MFANYKIFICAPMNKNFAYLFRYRNTRVRGNKNVNNTLKKTKQKKKGRFTEHEYKWRLLNEEYNRNLSIGQLNYRDKNITVAVGSI